MDKAKALAHLAKVIATVSPAGPRRRVVYFDFRCREWMSQTWGTFAVDWGSYLRNRLGNVLQGGASTSNHALIRVCTSYAEYLRERQADWHLFGNDAETVAPEVASFYISARHLVAALNSDGSDGDVAAFVQCLEAEATCGALTLDGSAIVADRSFAYGGGLCPEQGALAEDVVPLFHGFDTLDLLSLYSEPPSVSLDAELMTRADMGRKLGALGREGRAESTRWLQELGHDIELLTVRVSGVPASRLARLVSTFGASARAYYPSRDELGRINGAKHLCLRGAPIPSRLGASAKVVCWFEYAGQADLWSERDRVKEVFSPGLILGGPGRFRGSPHLFVGGSLLAAMKWQMPAPGGGSPTALGSPFSIASMLAQSSLHIDSPASLAAASSAPTASNASAEPSPSLPSSGSYSPFFEDSEPRASTFGSGPLRPGRLGPARRRHTGPGGGPFLADVDDYPPGSAGDVAQTDETRVEIGAARRGGPGFYAASNGAIRPRESTNRLTHKIATASARVRSGGRARQRSRSDAIYDAVLAVERVETRSASAGVGSDADLAAATLTIEAQRGASARLEAAIAKNQVRAHVDVFVGAELTVTSEVRISGLTMVAEHGAVFGVGGSGRFEASRVGSKLRFRGKLKASAGVGVSEDVSLEVDFERLATDLHDAASAVATAIGEQIPTREEARARVRELIGLDPDPDPSDVPLPLPEVAPPSPLPPPVAEEGPAIEVEPEVETEVAPTARETLSDDALQITIMLAEVAGRALMKWHAGGSAREVARAVAPTAAKHALTLSEPFMSAVAGQWSGSAKAAALIGLQLFAEASDGASARELAGSAAEATLEAVGPLVIEKAFAMVGAASLALPATYLFKAALLARDAPGLVRGGRHTAALELAAPAGVSVAAGAAATTFGSMAAGALVGSRDLPKAKEAGAVLIATIALGAATYGARSAVAYRTRLWDARGDAAGQEAYRQFLNDDSLEGRYWQMLLKRLGVPSGDVASLKEFSSLAYLISAAPPGFWMDHSPSGRRSAMDAMDVLILATYGRVAWRADWSSRMRAFATSLDARHPSKSALLRAASAGPDG